MFRVYRAWPVWCYYKSSMATLLCSLGYSRKRCLEADANCGRDRYCFSLHGAICPQESAAFIYGTVGFDDGLPKAFGWRKPVSELFERTYNYAVPCAAFLMVLWDSKRHGWRHRVKPVPTLSTKHWRVFKVLLQITIGVYLISHGAFGVFDGKAGLAHQYDATGISALFGSTSAAMSTIGWFEIVLSVLALALPVAPLLFFVCAWKIATESLFIFSGAFYSGFEFMERGASMVAPIALYFVIQIIAARQPASIEPAVKISLR